MLKRKQNREKGMTVLEHLEELRRVLIISILATFLMAAASWAFNERSVKKKPVEEVGFLSLYSNQTTKLSHLWGEIPSAPRYGRRRQLPEQTPDSNGSYDSFPDSRPPFSDNNPIKVSTRRGSNWLPAHLFSSPRASSCDIAPR